MTTARRVVDDLRSRGATVATGESLTGGLVCAALVDVPGASDVVRGGIVAYQAELKTSLLGVPAELIAERGTVDPDVAAALARGARSRCGATYGVGTTGVAGPGPSEGKPQGAVFVAVVGPDDRAQIEELTLDGDRAEVRRGAVAAALSALAGRLRREESGAGTR
ncbi:nicotinamide-nucleotide amidohydrolase family protein [Aeromicrobium phragmitis]|uniref:Nicotinamide-nucleotide amidohydrolase family protein n=1 Tax=Aeromicrobium phragmitis TaxID=2478914 RepID=A0A3L8PQB6_9ACTN|nr:nicotinamide-nucleotide amidohydrolase family protein [Aeromicrobium phragmitis]RLV57029.1 nicotinamide-nucleotide amidohydrolase family protein [Aeromicrobium phragmitis]